VASAISHFVVGAGVGLAAIDVPSLRAVMPRWAIPVTAGLMAMAPDLDTLAMFAFEIPRGSIWAHRGIFHSAAFLILLAILLAVLVARSRAWLPLAAVWAVAAVTHPLLDMLTDGGSGVLLLYPFSDQRMFFSWRPIRVSPLGILRFFGRAPEILPSEVPFDALALMAGLMVRRTLKAVGQGRAAAP
jgi:inner membrane protein